MDAGYTGQEAAEHRVSYVESGGRRNWVPGKGNAAGRHYFPASLQYRAERAGLVGSQSMGGISYTEKVRHRNQL